MTSVDSNFNFRCGRSHGTEPPSPVHMRPPEPDPSPPCGRHKWMAFNKTKEIFIKPMSTIIKGKSRADTRKAHKNTVFIINPLSATPIWVKVEFWVKVKFWVKFEFLGQGRI